MIKTEYQGIDLCECGPETYPHDGVDLDMSMEHMLNDDAKWKNTQKNAFTRWANERLKISKQHIEDMECDLADGIRLITLVESLTQKKLPKYNKRPVFRSQKLENVSLVLNYLQEKENIRIVNIDSTDIVDCKLKLILGLIWTLILHYSISVPMSDEPFLTNGDKDFSPKQRLMLWIQKMLPDLKITNFTTDWNDGKAVGALVDAMAPDLCPDWADWDPNEALVNASEAMSLAHDWLNVAQLIKPEEIIDPNIDEQSVMTYLSQFPGAALTKSFPFRPRTNPTSIPPPRVRVYGPGVEEAGPVVGAPANFTVETFGAGSGDIEVAVENPRGYNEPVKCRHNNEESSYSVAYVPAIEGKHKVSVKYSGREVPRSPFLVNVARQAGDATKVSASGPGLKPDNVTVNKPTYFDIYTQNAGNGVPEVIILDPSGRSDTVSAKLQQTSPDIWRCDYLPPVVGLYSVNIFFAGSKISKSPFGVRVVPVSDPSRVTASGRGLQPKGVRVRDNVDFNVNTEGAGEGDVRVRINGPGGLDVPFKIKKVDGNKYNVAYQPLKEGRYIVIITFAGEDIPKSPFTVQAAPQKETMIQAYGPGLKGGIAGYPAYFVVKTNGETGSIRFCIHGPTKTTIECANNGDGSADVRYHPSVPGEYTVHILCDDEDIPNSPYITQILPKTSYYPDKVQVYGPGIEPQRVYKNETTTFAIDRSLAGDAPIDVNILDADNKAVDVLLNQISSDCFEVLYTPLAANLHTIEVNHAGVATRNSPYRVDVQEWDLCKFICHGPGLKDGVKVNTPTYFHMNAKNVDLDDINLTILNETKNLLVPVQISDNKDGNFTVNYNPTQPGQHIMSVINMRSPSLATTAKFQVVPAVDISKIKVDGLEQTAPVNSLQQFRVITPDAGKAEFAISITTPSGSKVKALVIPTHEGYLVNFTPTQLGEYLLGISFGGEPIFKRPYKITCLTGSDSNKVKAAGPGLHRGIVHRPAEFIIDTRGAGQGGLGVTVEGPCEAAINCRDNGDGTCSVAYLPTEVGDYDINITFNDQHIPSSPFHAIIVSEIDMNKIKVSGFGVQLHGVFVNSPTDFLVDARELVKAGDNAKVTCTITNPSGAQTNKSVTSLNDGTYKVSYTPFEEGRHTIEILYDNMPVPGSPFVVNVRSGCDSRKVQAYGPGLEHGIVDEKNPFTVETKGAGIGKLNVSMLGPAEAEITGTDNKDGSCSLNYIPTIPGEYQLTIKYSDQEIPGSPFKVMADYNDAVRIYGSAVESKVCRANVPTEFTVDASKSKDRPISVLISSDNGPVRKQIIDNGNNIYKILFQPPPNASNLQVHLKQNNIHIPNSPLNIKVLPYAEPEKIKVDLSDKEVAASLPTTIKIDTNEAGCGVLEVSVKGPDGTQRNVELNNNEDGTYCAIFVPDDCGTYVVNVKYAGEKVPGCPYTTQAYSVGSAEKCKITEGAKKQLNIGEEYCITVNTKNAGIGALTCKVRSNNSGSDLDIKIVDNGDGTVSIYYNVPDSGEYTINIKFGGKTVPGGFYTFKAEEIRKTEHTTYSKTESVQEIFSSSNRTTASAKSELFRKLHLQRIPLAETGGFVQADIKMPSGNVDKPVIEDNHDGTVSVKYDPREEGLHELAVKYNGEHVQGSPFKFHVDSISSGYVTAYGPGLTHGVTGEPSNFTISTKGAGPCGLSMAVEGPSRTEITHHDNKDGTIGVSYLATVPGEYKISVKFEGDKHIKGSPFVAKITGEGRKRNQISVGTCSEVSLPWKISDADVRSLNASIQAPSGLEEPCFLKRFPNGNIVISFTPREIGGHVVSVKKLGKHITNSPFKIEVCAEEVGDAKKVKVSGNALKEGKTQVNNVFTVDTRKAGYGGLSLSIEGPSRAEIQCTDKEDGTLNISYKPTEPGFYIINLKFADHHVDGSPYTVKVSGEGTNRQREKIQRQREAVPLTEVGSKCKLTFKMPGITSFDLSANVTSPGGVMEDAVINEVLDGLYAVHFVPNELGVHTVSVKYKDIHIPGSPFQFTVGPLKDSGSHLVKAGGAGLERGEQGAVNEFNVWTREAGKGQLAISVEGPSKAEINFTDRKDGSCEVAYKVSEPGEYRIGLKFNDAHVPDSPFKVYISPAVGDAHLLEVAQFPQGAVQADKPSQFMVRKNGAKGELDAKIVGPSGHEEDCFTQMADLEEYSVRFMPRENGVHKIHAKFNGVHIPGSPFSIRVGKDTADPAAVHAAGPGLRDIKTGVKTDFIIDTVNAGVGTLAVTIDGPSKVSMDCTDVEEGYKVRYTPLAPGDYFISIKYNNNHIVGSPFKVHSTGDSSVVDIGSQETSSAIVETVAKTGKPMSQGPKVPKFKSDAKKVTSKGMGLKKAYLGKQNQFTVSANDAGANFLFVGIHGPKGPCDEVSVKHTGRDQYNVSYLARDRGDYIIIVKWGDENIPGSPFKVEV